MDQIESIPFLLTASHSNSWSFEGPDNFLTAQALAKTDLYCNPKNGLEIPGTLSALTLTGLPRLEDFQISAQIHVQFNADYDAGALVIWANDKTWAKLCFEYSPDQEAMVVSVVTLGTSDDANSFTLPTNEVYLRISRMGHVYAFHASSGGELWKMIRVFTLGEDI
jgi:regulation of enolase protein 1 (concanavalin A-like superfamily)